jgi:hypothetical protein
MKKHSSTIEVCTPGGLELLRSFTLGMGRLCLFLPSCFPYCNSGFGGKRAQPGGASNDSRRLCSPSWSMVSIIDVTLVTLVKPWI